MSVAFEEIASLRSYLHFVQCVCKPAVGPQRLHPPPPSNSLFTICPSLKRQLLSEGPLGRKRSSSFFYLHKDVVFSAGLSFFQEVLSLCLSFPLRSSFGLNSTRQDSHSSFCLWQFDFFSFSSCLLCLFWSFYFQSVGVSDAVLVRRIVIVSPPEQVAAVVLGVQTILLAILFFFILLYIH